MAARREYPNVVRWKGHVSHDRLTAAQLRARLDYLRRRYQRSLRQTPGATAEHERWAKWVRRYERWLDEAR